MKITDLGWAKPDDPIYQTGVVIGGRRIGKASDVAANSDHSHVEYLDPMQPVAERLEGFLQNDLKPDRGEPTDSE